MAKQLIQFPMAEKRKKEEESTSNIPHDVVIEELLPRLPVKSLLRFISVCKLWFNSINNQPEFVSSHFLQSQKTPDLIFTFLVKTAICVNPPSILGRNCTIHLYSINHKNENHINGGGGGPINHNLGKIATIQTTPVRHVVGFCNGLVCIRRNSVLEVCNPSRREVLTIMSPRDYKLRSTFGFGFGFDPLTKEYKVVSISKEYKCMIFTLGSSSWREISGPNPVPSRLIKPIELAVLCNGVLFFTTFKLSEIVSFDLHTETFQVIRCPFKYDCSNDYYHLEYKGSLCLARLERAENYGGNCMVQLQILKDRIKEVWVEENICIPFSYPGYEYTIRFVGFSDQVLLCWFVSDKIGYQLYNLQSEKLMEIKHPGYRVCGMDYHLTSHVENFLPLRTLVQHSESFCRVASLNAYLDDQDRIFKI